MKTYITILSILFCSCAGNSNNNVNPSNPGAVGAHFIDNWFNNDTLVGVVLDQNNNAIGFDTMITKKTGDTSLFYYHGIKYYIWKQPLAGSITDTFKEDQQTYVNCCVSTTLDTIGAASFNWLTGAQPYRYKDATGQWNYQYQGVSLGDYTKFKKVSGNVYLSHRIHN